MHVTYSPCVWSRRLLLEEVEGAKRRLLVNETNSFSRKPSLGVSLGTLRPFVSVSILWSDGYK